MVLVRDRFFPDWPPLPASLAFGPEEEAALESIRVVLDWTVARLGYKG